MSNGQFAFMDEQHDEPEQAETGILWRIASHFGIKRSDVRFMPLDRLLSLDQLLSRPRGWSNGLKDDSGPAWGNAGIGGPGLRPATFRVPESPANPVESSLADVLEDDSTWPRERFLDIGQQVRILSRLAWYEKWETLRAAMGDGYTPDQVADYEANHRHLAPAEGSRSLDLAEITRRLEQSGY